MERLKYENYEELVCDIVDNLNSTDDKYGEVSVIAKYNEAREIIKELLCIGYSIASIDLHREEFEEYWNEYIIGLNFDGVWCEKFKRDSGYFTDDSNVIYIMGNCSSAVVPYCKSEEIYEVSVDVDISDNEDFDDEEDSKSEHEYIVNGEKVDKETFDNYVSKFAPDKVEKKENKPSTISSATYKINGKEVLKDTYEFELEKIEGVYLDNMRDVLLGYAKFMDEMNEWRKLFRW